MKQELQDKFFKAFPQKKNSYKMKDLCFGIEESSLNSSGTHFLMRKENEENKY